MKADLGWGQDRSGKTVVSPVSTNKLK